MTMVLGYGIAEPVTQIEQGYANLGRVEVALRWVHNPARVVHLPPSILAEEEKPEEPPNSLLIVLVRGRNLPIMDQAMFGAGKESEMPNFKGPYLGRFPLVSADFWTSDHLSKRSRSMDAVSGTIARGTLIWKRTRITLFPPRPCSARAARRTPSSSSSATASARRAR
jgi:hypothetical protein